MLTTISSLLKVVEQDAATSDATVILFMTLSWIDLSAQDRQTDMLGITLMLTSCLCSAFAACTMGARTMNGHLASACLTTQHAACRHESRQQPQRRDACCL